MTETRKAAGGGQTALQWNSLSGLQENQMMAAPEANTACSTMATYVNGTMILVAMAKALCAARKFAQVQFLFVHLTTVQPTEIKNTCF